MPSELLDSGRKASPPRPAFAALLSHENWAAENVEMGICSLGPSWHSKERLPGEQGRRGRRMAALKADLPTPSDAQGGMGGVWV
jgi:hypothetical protein